MAKKKKPVVRKKAATRKPAPARSVARKPAPARSVARKPAPARSVARKPVPVRKPAPVAPAPAQHAVLAAADARGVPVAASSPAAVMSIAPVVVPVSPAALLAAPVAAAAAGVRTQEDTGLTAPALAKQWQALTAQFDLYQTRITDKLVTQAIQKAISDWQDWYFGNTDAWPADQLNNWKAVLKKTGETLDLAIKPGTKAKDSGTVFQVKGKKPIANLPGLIAAGVCVIGIALAVRHPRKNPLPALTAKQSRARIAYLRSIGCKVQKRKIPGVGTVVSRSC